MKFSYWEASTFIKDIDYLIVGAGITGLSAAISLRKIQPTARIVILERGFLPMGASTRNAGFACFGSLTELASDLNAMGHKATWRLVEKRWKGLLLLRSRLGDAAFRYENLGGYEVFFEQDGVAFAKAISLLKEANDQLERITGIKNTFSERKINDFGIKNSKHFIVNKSEGQLNPALMMQSLFQLAQKNNIDIFWGSEVEDWTTTPIGVAVQLKTGQTIQTKKILIAVNGFAKRLLPETEIQPARNWIMVTEPIQNLKIKGTFHYDEGYYYFRNIGDRVLLGGGRKLDFDGETTDAFGSNEKIKTHLTTMLKEVILPQHNFNITHQWSGIMGVGEAKEPILKQVSENVYLAVRLGGMGIALGSQLGADAANMLTNRL